MKNLRKIICSLLVLAMLVPMMSFMASAADLVNLYDLAAVKCGTPQSSADSDPKYNANYYCSGKIEVKPGDVLTFGPVMTGQGYYLTVYTETGSVLIQQVKYADCKKVDEFHPLTEIVEWTVPANAASIRMATAQLFYDSTLITKNQTFKVADYYAYMDKNNINIDHLRTTTTAADKLVNIFPKSDKVFEGRADAKNAEIASGAYRTCPMVPVKEGDIVYFGAAALDQGYHLALQDANGNGTTTVNKNYMVQYDVVGNGFGIYAYRIRPGTGYVRVVGATGVYDDGIQLATINQPFDAATYMKMFNITLPGTVESTSPLKGKTMLFMGDSISYGSGDGVSPFRTGRAWAGRIADWTGAITTNASVGGAKVSFQRGDDNWVYSQYVPHQNTKFDIIVMHGGVNDARHNRTIGTLSEGKDEATLKKNQPTYAGGLEWIFYNVSKTNPDAKLFFIANHRLDGHSTGHAKDMSAYFNIAKAACEKWGIIFIDLYNNKELNDKLETTTTKYLPDTLHLNAAGYDIITPYIISALEAGLTAPVEPETTGPETTEAPVVTDEATEAPVVTDEPTDAPEATD
ncbi:MAG: SGNH/GDSL hydrolase family protein, partial [Clostridia bacterium]|nr:SGNH/GDSL hydrolase family protein [Clostridia bacterium]